MNFQTVEQANGNNIDMFATITELNESGYSKSNKPYQKITIIDDAGVKHKVTIRGSNLPTVAVLNQRQAFTLSIWRNPQSGNTGYSGFWNPKTAVGQTAGFQQPPQMPQNPPQATNYSQPAPNTTDSEIRIKAARIAATALGGTGVDSAPEVAMKIIDVASLIVPWLEKGQTPTFGVDEPPFPE